MNSLTRKATPVPQGADAGDPPGLGTGLVTGGQFSEEKIGGGGGNRTQRPHLERSGRVRSHPPSQREIGSPDLTPPDSSRQPPVPSPCYRSGQTVSRSDVARFFSKFEPEPNTGCWLWTATVAPSNGYARFSLGGKIVLAHRFAYELFVQPLPDGLEIDHLCRVRCCVNPRHLEAVSHRVNVRRSPLVRSVCTHEQTPENVYRLKGGETRCRPCRWARYARSKKRATP